MTELLCDVSGVVKISWYVKLRGGYDRGDRLVFASGTELHVVDREPQFFSERIQTPTKNSSAVPHSKEFRHIVHRIMNGHRRDVSCLDVVKGKPNIVASGAKDRKLVIWCMEV